MCMISDHFSSYEFACRCGCGFSAVSTELVVLLEDMRDYFSAPVIINSGCRCPQHNSRIGGAKTSLHLDGLAVDCMVNGYSSEIVYKWLESEYPNSLGLGLYRTFVHIDLRNDKTRWNRC